jgi:phospholipase C
MRQINHAIVLLLENRSFDHLFGFATPPPGQSLDNLLSLPTLPANLLDPSKPQSSDNPSFTTSQPAPPTVHDKEGPPHSFNAVNLQLTNKSTGPSAGSPIQNNGFVRAYADDLSRRTRNVDSEHVAEVMQCFSAGQLPAINQLAQEFCLCDQWHCEVPGPTMPNRMFMHAATSEGYIHNDFKRRYSSKTLYELFEEKGFTWAIYFSDLHDLLQFPKLAPTKDHFRRFDQWASDVAGGNLPTFAFLFPRFMNGRDSNGGVLNANSQHAPEDARYADHFIADVYDALAANNSLFQQSALIVTYDEHGGFYDHVLPGPALNPDGMKSPNPDDRANFKVPSFSFDRIGLRVPAVIASPWIAKGTVEHRQLQHTSVIKTMAEMFGLNGPLNKRDESARSFADLFQQLAQPRPADDMPARLKRPPLNDTVESVVAGVPVHPADEPLDSLTEEWAMGMLSLLQGGLESVEEVPTTQGDASAAIDRALRARGL